MDVHLILWILLRLVCYGKGIKTLSYSNLVKYTIIVVVSGVEFFLRGRSIPTDDSGHLLITDISLHNKQTSTSNEEALICRSSRNVIELKTLPNANNWILRCLLPQTLSVERELVKKVMTEDGL